LERPLANISIAFAMAVAAAISLAYIGHYDAGLSRHAIRTVAIAGAMIVAMLMAVEYFGEKFSNPE
jgi:F0F1-type ATP synthase membrane subunit a